MNPKLIVMLTLNDQTVENAIEIFETCKDLPVEMWGFKNIGISVDKMKMLINALKTANKKSVLEVVTYTEESSLEAAKFALEYGFDYLIGTKIYPSVLRLIHDSDIKYFPFIGEVYSNPSILAGNENKIVQDALNSANLDIEGINLLAYRYIDGDPVALANAVVRNCYKKVIVAGSINNKMRLQEIKEINPWAFTIGGALFNSSFVTQGSFRDNLEKVLELMNSIY